MPVAETHSGRIYYDECGDGPALLVTHGGPGLHHGPYRSLDPFASSHRVIYWDHRGHGRSDPLPSGQVPMSLFADDVIAVADSLDVDTFALFGHSFGGWVAQEATLRHPDRISKLILAATTPGQLGATESVTDEQGPPMPDEVVALIERAPSSDADLVETYTRLAPYFTRTADPSVLIDALDESLVSADGFVKVFTALASWSSVDRLHEVRCPTLVLAGRYDIFCSPPQLERIARRIAEVDVLTFDSGHFMWLEQPDDFFQQVTPWLVRH